MFILEKSYKNNNNNHLNLGKGEVLYGKENISGRGLRRRCSGCFS